MSVWELEIKRPQDFRSLKTIYMVTTIDSKDKNAKKKLADEYNDGSQYRDFRKTIKSAHCIAEIDPDSADRMKGVYPKEELESRVRSFKEGCEIAAERHEKQSHNLSNLVSLLSQK